MSEAVAPRTPARPSPARSGDEPGWFARLRARLGLSQSPDLRDVIADALKQEPASARSFSPQERTMLLNILRFGDLRIEDVMVPRADVVAVDEDVALSELLETFEKAGHSRVPVFHETLDDPRGMVHIKDLMSWITGQSAVPDATNQANPAGDTDETGEDAENAEDAKARALDLHGVDLSRPLSSTSIRRDVLFVPPSMSVLDLLVRMQSTRIHLALVVDEYGGTDGLVSIEDLVEEIVGEIEDEHDVNDAPLIREDKQLGLVADARAPIEDLEERLGVTLLSEERDEDVGTLGGLVFTLAGRVPVRGELVPHASGIEFEVLDVDARRIKKLRIHLTRSTPRESGPAKAGGGTSA